MAKVKTRIKKRTPKSPKLKSVRPSKSSRATTATVTTTAIITATAIITTRTKTVKRKRKVKQPAPTPTPMPILTNTITERFACPICRCQFTATVDNSFITMYTYDRFYHDILSKFCPSCWTTHTGGRFM